MALACHRGTKAGGSTHEPRARRALPAVICAAVYNFKHSTSLLPSLLKVANHFMGGYSDSGICVWFLVVVADGLKVFCCWVSCWMAGLGALGCTKGIMWSKFQFPSSPRSGNVGLVNQPKLAGPNHLKGPRLCHEKKWP